MIAFLFLGVGLHGSFAQEKEAGSPKLYAVMFHADYCGACKAITPKIMDLKSQVDAEEVQFVKFDFTSDETREASYKKAEELGLADVYKANRGTGFVVLVNASDKKEKAVLTNKQSTDEMLAQVGKYL